MAAISIQSSDLVDFSRFPNPQTVSPALKSGVSNEFTDCYYPRVGSIRFKSDLFAHMHIMDLRWDPEEDIALSETVPSDNININFHLSGNLDTRFYGIKNELNMRARKHNLVFSPDQGYVNRLFANNHLEMFHISLERHFFANAIGCSDAWSEQLQQNLYHNRSFAGVDGTLDVTAPMLRIIDEIRQPAEPGPMRNLLIQSKTLELLSLQIEQFRLPGFQEENIRPEEAEKLYELKRYLYANFLAALNLSQLSRICTLNEFKVKKGFKALFGTTVFGYLRKLRMDYAKKLLLDSSLSVEEVSDKLGYEHAHHFSTAFKKYTGTNPSKLHNRVYSKTYSN